jgi:hypothetical protein
MMMVRVTEMKGGVEFRRGVMQASRDDRKALDTRYIVYYYTALTDC